MTTDESPAADRWPTLTMTLTTSDKLPIRVRSISIDTGWGPITLRCGHPLADETVITFPICPDAFRPMQIDTRGTDTHEMINLAEGETLNDKDD